MMRRAGATIACATSGSSVSITAVEPLRSANNAVTILRSPSGGPSASGIDGGADETVNRFGASAAAGIAAPQSPQKRLESGFSAPHFAQRIFAPDLNHLPSSSSNALASMRSAVSKPSVNQ